MKIRFWGVRGDIAVPGPGTLRYGGHTLCAEVSDQAGRLCILDAGTGLIALGRVLMQQDFGRGMGDALMLISHGDWDHTQGIGFFAPFFVPGNRFTLHGLGGQDLRFFDRMEAQLAAAVSPLQTFNHLKARLVFRESDEFSFTWGGIDVSSRPLPAGIRYAGGYPPLAYRLTEGDRSLVYLPKGENPGKVIDRDLSRFCEGADLLVHEAFSSDQDYEPGWGHSGPSHAVALAESADIARLVLTHFGPAYDDDQIDRLVDACRTRFTGEILPAQEGLELVV